MNYVDYLASKSRSHAPSGFDPHCVISPVLFPFQRELVTRSLKLGRAAIFADCGLGKTLMQIEWAQHVSGVVRKPVLILAPLAVAEQTVREAKKLSRVVHHVHKQPSDLKSYGIFITNYEKLHLFDASAFGGVVLDESSILKNYTGATRNALINAFAKTPYKLACTATPSPNDFMELGNHAEFLNVMSRTEMLSMFFVHDGGETQKWRLKRHATKDFWAWVSSWSMMLKNPSDIGFSQDGYDLPELTIKQVCVEAKNTGDMLIAMPACSLQERQAARRNSIDDRIKAAVDLINQSWHTIPNISEPTPLKTEKKLGRTLRRGISKTTSDSLKNPENTPQQTMTEDSNGAENIEIEQPKSEESTCGKGTGKTESISLPLIGNAGKKSPKPREIGIYEQNTESVLINITNSSKETVEDVQFAAASKKSGSMLITTTKQASSGDSSAIAATWELEGSETMQTGSSGLPSTSVEQWVIWCALNSEQDRLAHALQAHCVSVHGSLSSDEKIARYRKFESGHARVLISKPSILGWGLNMQFCRNMLFLGIGDSFEEYYQALRRVYRFGQERPVNVWIVTSNLEGAVVENIKRKQADAEHMASEMAKQMSVTTKTL